QLDHVRLAESHDLFVGAALGIEIRSALAAADRQPGERVLEDLLETEELDDPDVHRGMEAQPALVGPERRIELHPEPAMDPHLAAIVDPRHAEDDLAFGLANPLDQRAIEIAGMLGHDATEAFEHFGNGLVELYLTGVPAQNLIENRLQFFVYVGHSASACPSAVGPCSLFARRSTRRTGQGGFFSAMVSFASRLAPAGGIPPAKRG